MILLCFQQPADVLIIDTNKDSNIFKSQGMMKDMTLRHQYDNLIRDIPIYDGKNMEFADWLLQIEKVALLTNSQEYKLTTA